ncbi:GTP-binding protein 2 [Naviculisporaceae sp. PSN 640]
MSVSSVFGFKESLVRVASPWLGPADTDRSPGQALPPKRPNGRGPLADYSLTKLEPEPQDGSIEYKLHLLLRPRRKYERTSTATWISGSTQSRPPPDPTSLRAGPMASGSSHSSAQTRQDRLEHLTTQLLWRLQQSCPYHAGSAAPNLVVPRLPDESLDSNAPIRLERVFPGLEASRGALYEIGVADDGTLVGLTKDELEESLRTLRIMAASLGCSVKILRTVSVGECEWIDPISAEEGQTPSERTVRHQAKLWVAEARVTPDLRPRDTEQPLTKEASPSEPPQSTNQGPLTANQLRVTLTGPTTSGKSTLLGTLSTGVLDNGRGTSRLSLLKHLHEVTSGITSSIAQELVGYNDGEVINYSSRGVESWIDIHDFTRAGRLAYILDTPGHPKFCRTTLRSLVGWAPHWTLLCIAADSSLSTPSVDAMSSPAEALGPVDPQIDLIFAHLEMCLRLRVPLVVVLTKLDLASRRDLVATLSKVLTKIKERGRTPHIVKEIAGDNNTEQLSSAKVEEVKRVLGLFHGDDDLSSVPIVLTSAVDGRGIGLLHALLQNLPLPPTPTSHDYIGAALNPEQPACLFHIEDKYSLPASSGLITSDADQQTDHGTVVAGHLRFGNMSIGDKVVVGPFPSEELPSRDPTPEDAVSGGYGLSVSPEMTRITANNVVSASTIKGEWHTATIVSLRNLRLPIHTLEAGQVGSIGIVFDKPTHLNPADAEFHAGDMPTPKIRKGMVVAVPSQHMVATGLSLQAASGLTAVFRDSTASSLTVGSFVSVYTASVKTSARVVRISKTMYEDDNSSELATEDIDDTFFGLSDETDLKNVHAVVSTQSIEENGTEVQLELLSTREWVELGSPIVILEGRDRDRSGLGVIVGKVVEITE